MPGPASTRGRSRSVRRREARPESRCEFRVRAGTLDPVDIPAGPFGYTIGIPWFGDDPEAARFNRQMATKSLQKLREYGFTACSGLPSIAYRGFNDGKPRPRLPRRPTPR